MHGRWNIAVWALLGLGVVALGRATCQREGGAEAFRAEATVEFRGRVTNVGPRVRESLRQPGAEPPVVTGVMSTRRARASRQRAGVGVPSSLPPT
jgi:hypothetical protein